MSHFEETPRFEDEKRGGYRQRLLLVGIVLVNLCLYGGLFLMNQSETVAASAPALAAGEPVMLKEAYQQALARALAWQPDVQLFGVTASWQLSSGDSLTLGRPAWSFNFYSAATRQAQSVIVDESGAQLGRQQALRQAPQHVVPDWNLDSDALLLTFLSYGGEAFLGEHPQANVHLQLKCDASGRPVWYVSAVDPVARESLMVGVDAQSRQVVVGTGNQGGG